MDDPSVDGVTPAYTIDLSGYDDAIDNLNTLINGINTKIGTVPDNKTVISLIGDAQGKANANEEAIAAINDSETGILQKSKEYTDGLVGVIPLVRDEEIGEAVPAADTVIEYFEGKLGNVNADAATLKNRVDTLVGVDVSKSVRTIANEELAAQLLSGKADADFKTLQQLAAWLENHPEEVSAINLDIINIKKLIGTLPTSVKDGETEPTPDFADVVTMITTLVNNEVTRATGVETGLDNRLKSIEETIGDGGDIDTRIEEAVNALNYTYDGTETDVVIGVSQENGIISVQKANIVFASEQQISSLFTEQINK